MGVRGGAGGGAGGGGGGGPVRELPLVLRSGGVVAEGSRVAMSQATFNRLTEAMDLGAGDSDGTIDDHRQAVNQLGDLLGRGRFAVQTTVQPTRTRENVAGLTRRDGRASTTVTDLASGATLTVHSNVAPYRQPGLGGNTIVVSTRTGGNRRYVSLNGPRAYVSSVYGSDRTVERAVDVFNSARTGTIPPIRQTSTETAGLRIR